MNLSEDELPEQPTSPEPTPTAPEEKSKPFKIEVLDKVSTLIAAAFGFVAAFAWNETFKVILLGGVAGADKPLVLIGYALFVTFLAVILTIIVARAAAKADGRTVGGGQCGRGDGRHQNERAQAGAGGED